MAPMVARIQNSRGAIPGPALALALLVALLVALASPTLLWAYHLTRAGALLEAGLAWPTPRLADSLPATGDAGALRAAREHLAAAERWRPDHPHAYRLAGHVALAEGDWQGAVELLEAAVARAPRNPLLGWELGLTYERLWRAEPGDTALRDRMLGAWRGAGMTVVALEARAVEAEVAGRADEAAVWRGRAELLAESDPSPEAKAAISRS
jgi:tetratricopeptide (TPR) repeat protein